MTKLPLFCAMAAVLAAQQKLAPLDESGYGKLVAAHKGKVVLVDFWATWCVPCRAETPELAKLASKLRARGFDLVTISADEPEQEAAAIKFLKDAGVTGPAYLKQVADEDKFSTSLDAKWFGGLPAMFLYDRSGKKTRAFLGETPVKEIEAAIAKLL
jgi:thiol-disulfide isomerase/thioredoxin